LRYDFPPPPRAYADYASEHAAGACSILIIYVIRMPLSAVAYVCRVPIRHVAAYAMISFDAAAAR